MSLYDEDEWSTIVDDLLELIDNLMERYCPDKRQCEDANRCGA